MKTLKMILIKNKKYFLKNCKCENISLLEVLK